MCVALIPKDSLLIGWDIALQAHSNIGQYLSCFQPSGWVQAARHYFGSCLFGVISWIALLAGPKERATKSYEPKSHNQSTETAKKDAASRPEASALLFTREPSCSVRPTRYASELFVLIRPLLPSGKV